jgi:hypothetical protein
MTDIMLSNEDMQYINMANKVTKTDILDCISTGTTGCGNWY